MHDSRLRGFVAALATIGVACSGESAGLDPPGFGGEPARLFFPTGLSLAPDGQSLYVVNSNFDRAFVSGTVVQLALTAFDGAGAVDVGPHIRSQGTLGSFGDQARVNAAGDALFVATGDPSALVRVPLAAGTNAITCSRGNDCGADAVDLSVQSMDRPGSIALIGGPNPLVLVGHTSPAQESGDTTLPARIAVIPERLATKEALPFSNGAYTVVVGAGSLGLLFDAAQGRVLLGGCYERVRGGTVQPCSADSGSALFKVNPLRSFALGAGAGASVQTNALGGNIGGGTSTALAFSSTGRDVYALTAAPNTLLVTDVPLPGGTFNLQARAIVPLPEVPRALVVLPRAIGDLVVVTSLEKNALLLVDPVSALVLAQLTLVGGGPYDIAVQDTADGWRLYVSLSDACGVAAVDVPEADPSKMRLVSIAGRCP